MAKELTSLRMEIVMWVNTKTASLMVKVPILGPMGVSMRASLKLDSNMAMELGENIKTMSLLIVILVIILTIRSMDMASSTGNQVTYIRATTITMNETVMERCILQMAPFIRATGLVVSRVVKALSSWAMEPLEKVSLVTTSFMERIVL
jgi:hypothetical protein